MDTKLTTGSARNRKVEMSLRAIFIVHETFLSPNPPSPPVTETKTYEQQTESQTYKHRTDTKERNRENRLVIQTTESDCEFQSNTIGSNGWTR